MTQKQEDYQLLGDVEAPLQVFPHPNSCRYQEITHSIYLARKPNLGLKSCDGNQELLNFLRSDLIEVATRLQKGGLGYMEGTSEFEARVRGQVNTHESYYSAWRHFQSCCLTW